MIKRIRINVTYLLRHRKASYAFSLTFPFVFSIPHLHFCYLRLNPIYPKPIQHPSSTCCHSSLTFLFTSLSRLHCHQTAYHRSWTPYITLISFLIVLSFEVLPTNHLNFIALSWTHRKILVFVVILFLVTVFTLFISVFKADDIMSCFGLSYSQKSLIIESHNCVFDCFDCLNCCCFRVTVPLTISFVFRIPVHRLIRNLKVSIEIFQVSRLLFILYSELPFLCCFN